MKTRLLVLLLFTALSPFVSLAQSVGGGGGADRPGYMPASYMKSSLCAADEWKVDWEMTDQVNDRLRRQFWTCEAKPIPQARYIRNPSNRCVETGKPQAVTVPTPNGRSVLKWEICKNGKYVIYDP